MLGKMFASVLAVAALAVTPVAHAQGQWTPYHAEDFSYAAGTVCPFELAAHIVRDKERYRTTAYFPDGSPRYQEFTGQLVIRYTNTETGKSVVRNLTGRGDFEYFADGGFALYDKGGHIAVGLYPGDEPGAGYYIITGHGWAVYVDADGDRTLVEGHGTIENLCVTLG